MKETNEAVLAVALQPAVRYSSPGACTQMAGFWSVGAHVPPGGVASPWQRFGGCLFRCGDWTPFPSTWEPKLGNDVA